MTEGSKKGFLGGNRLLPEIFAWFATGATLVALGNVLLLMDGDAVGWKKWLHIAWTAAEGLLAIYFWALFVHRRRANSPH
jgi:hypothetical protein